MYFTDKHYTKSTENNKFIPEKSITFKCKSNTTKIQLAYGNSYGFKAEDFCSFDSEDFQIDFLLLKNHIHFSGRYDKNSVIGFGPQLNSNQIKERNEKYSFIKTLHNNLSLSYSFFFEFHESSSGVLVIGALPHEINPSKFKEKNYKFVGGLLTYNSVKWGHVFDVVDIQNPFNKEVPVVKFYDLTTYFALEFNYIHVDIGVFNFFKTRIFMGLERTCEYKKEEEINYFKCKKIFDINQFKKIILYSRKLEMSFELDAKDLFLETDDGYIFLIINLSYEEEYEIDYWILGKPFLIYCVIIFLFFLKIKLYIYFA